MITQVRTAVRSSSEVQEEALSAPSAAAPMLLGLGESHSPETELAPAAAAAAALSQPAPAVGWPVNQPPPDSRPVTAPRPFEVQPLTAGQSRMHVTVSREFLGKLGAAQDALSHAMPDATPAEILEAGLELLLAQAAKRRGQVERPQKKLRPAKADHIPAHVRREVWARDGGRCQFPLASGGICGATRHLELDHIHPRSLGGPSTADNLRVVCKPHGDLAARQILGDEVMDRYRSGLRGARRPLPAGASGSAPGAAPP